MKTKADSNRALRPNMSAMKPKKKLPTMAPMRQMLIRMPGRGRGRERRKGKERRGVRRRRRGREKGGR
jgi:hypothetical protein